jgi:non-ribosomal peptide synthetase component E (peptide arylation enzyme)
LENQMMTVEAAATPLRRGPEDAMTILSSLLDRAAADHPNRHPRRLHDLVLTYAHLREAAGWMATLLASYGIAPGDRVEIMLPNVPAFPIAFDGALAAGARVAPRNPLIQGREVACYLGDSGAWVVLAWHAAAGGGGQERRRRRGPGDHRRHPRPGRPARRARPGRGKRPGSPQP